MRIFRQGLQHDLLIRIYEGSLPAPKLPHNVKLLHFMMNNLCIAIILFSVVTENLMALHCHFFFLLDALQHVRLLMQTGVDSAERSEDTRLLRRT